MTETATETADVGQDDLVKMTKDELLGLAENCGLEIPKSAPKAAIVEAIEGYRARVAESVDASLAENAPEEIEAEAVEETDEEIESTALALREEPPAALPALLPTTGEFDAMLAIAGRIADTQIVPKAYRGRPDDVLAAILTGREMGLGPMQSTRDIYVIDGKPTFAAHLLLARMRQGGLLIEASESTAERAWVRARRRDTGEVAEVEWTIEEARTATTRENGKTIKLAEKSNWRNYPADMLWARCVGRLARRIGADLIGAVMPYSSEEVQDWDSDDAPADSGTPPSGFGSDKQAGQWIAPKDWAELSRRIAYQLGEDEAPAWMEELAEQAYKYPSIGDVVKDPELDRGRKKDLWERLLRVLRGLENADRPIDGPLTFVVGVREVVAKIIYDAFDGAVTLTGPQWALDPEEAKRLPQRDGTPPPEPAGADLPAAEEAATETSSETREAVSGPEDAPDAAPETDGGDDLDGIKF